MQQTRQYPQKWVSRRTEKRMRYLISILFAGLTFSAAVQAMAQADSEAVKPVDCVWTEVDYDRSPSEIAGKFDWAHHLFKAECFQAEPRKDGKVAQQLCWFESDRLLSTDKVQKKIEASGKCLVADLWEVSALRTANFESQGNLHVVGLGTKWPGSTCSNISVPVIERRGVVWFLDLGAGDSADEWFPGYYFGAVCQQSKTP